MDQFFISPLLADLSNASVQQHLQQQQVTSNFLDGNISPADYLEYLESIGTDVDEYLGEINPVIEKIVSGDLTITIL